MLADRYAPSSLQGFYMWQTDEVPKTVECRVWDNGAVSKASSDGAYKKAHVCCMFNSTGLSVWINGSQEAYTTVVLTPTAKGDLITMGGNNGGAVTWNGRLDEIVIVNRSLVEVEILSLFNDGVSGESTEVTAPTIIAPSPADNSNNNTNVTLNVSHTTTQTDVRYYLYFAESTPLDEGDFYIFNETRTGDEYKSFLTNVSDGTYHWKWKVQNITDGIFSGNTTERTLIIDTVSPTITLGGNNNFTTDNLTIISSYTHNLSINISFFDTHLAGGQTLINITNASGNSIFSILNTSITGTTANYTRVVDLSKVNPQNLTIKLIATDSHTANSINDYDVFKGLDYFRYTTEEGNVIKIKSDTFPLTRKTTKLKDRYDFEFNYLFQKDNYKFIIESYNRINYLSNSKYKAHFVIMAENGEGNWLDFENPNILAKDYTITKIDDYTYEVEIVANGLKSFKFSSLGGLNKREEHYLLRVGAVIDILSYDDDTGKGINATATLGSQVAHTVANTSSAKLVNVTKETISVVMNASGYGDETKAIEITSRHHNFSLNLTVVSAVKIHFFDERSENRIFAETFTVFLEKTGFAQTFTGITDNPHSILNLDSGIYELKASSSNYAEREYQNLNISNVTTTNINVYLINETLGSRKTFNIVDEALNPLDGVTVVFTKVINGSSTVVAQETSDFAGQVKLDLDSVVEYTINFSRTNFEDKTIKLEPSDTTYIIEMVSTVGKYNQSVHEGIRYSFSPINIVLNNNTNYNFTFILNSTVWPLTNCTLRLKNNSILFSETSSFSSTGCFLRIEMNTDNSTNITSEAIYELNSQFNFTVSQQYSVIITYQGQFSLKSFLDDISNLALAGFDNFGRMMLAFIVIFAIMVFAGREVGFENKEVLFFIFLGLVGFFSFVGWFTLGLDTIPTGFGLRKYFIFYLMIMVGIGFMINKFNK